MPCDFFYDSTVLTQNGMQHLLVIWLTFLILFYSSYKVKQSRTYVHLTEISNELPEPCKCIPLKTTCWSGYLCIGGAGGRVNPLKVQLLDARNQWPCSKDEKHVARSLSYSISPHMTSALPPLRGKVTFDYQYLFNSMSIAWHIQSIKLASVDSCSTVENKIKSNKFIYHR